VAIAADVYLELLSAQVRGTLEPMDAVTALANRLGRTTHSVEGKFMEMSQALRSLDLTPLAGHTVPLETRTRLVAANVMQEIRSRRTRGDLDWLPALPEDQRVVLGDEDDDQDAWDLD
jgi:hypothetical protein